jgi:hypothetical protein
MINIQFPKHAFKIKQDAGREVIFDVCRKQWVTLTPEEWVRQNFIQYLLQVMKYPSSLIAVERELKINDTKKRFDIVVFQQAKPWMIIECKEMNVPLTESVVTQILSYNVSLQVQYLVITNGSNTFVLHINSSQHEWMQQLPPFTN